MIMMNKTRIEENFIKNINFPIIVPESVQFKKEQYDEFQLIHEGKQRRSKYYTNEEKDRIVRVSDHWGDWIGACHWYLEGYPSMLSGLWKKQIENPKKIGIINVSDFSAVP